MRTQENMASKELAAHAEALFFSFRSAYANEWQRLENCERMYRGDHWHDVPKTDPNEPRPVTPILQSTVENVAAELMDRCPAAVIRPETGENERQAKIVEAVVARNHDDAAYAVEYQKLVHDLLVGGYCVQEVGYDTGLNNGLGGAFIRQVEPRSILFDPLVTDMQQGRAVFKFGIVTRAWLREHYPDHADKIADDPLMATMAPTDSVLIADRQEQLLLVEYWWRVYDREEKRCRVHMAVLCGGQVLEDSRKEKPEGYYAHGMYPFVLTPLFPRKGSALGFGLIDLFETQQRYADKLDQIVLKNAVLASHNKLLVTDASGFDPDDLRDWAREVHRGESLSGVTWFSTPALPGYLISYIEKIRESIKEESGANESSRGNVRQGVTAASAIEALQEASNKRARMATTQLHEAFRQAVRMEIEVEREYNFFLRPVRITENGRTVAAGFDSGTLFLGKGKSRVPVEFFVSVRAERQSLSSAAARNDTLMQLVAIGALDPADAVPLMDFDGKEQVVKAIEERKKAAPPEQQMQPGASAPPKQRKNILRIMGGKR